MKLVWVVAALIASMATVEAGAAVSAPAPERKQDALLKLYDNRHGRPVYFIRDTLRKKADYIQIDSLSDHGPDDPSGAKSSTSLMRFKCDKKEVSAVDIVTFSEKGGRGRMLERLLNPSTSFKPVERGSEREYMLEVACSL
ncbi:MAG: hypothetical protein HOQ32_18120 [Lysobacter sp.]|nr:hypothetical protein [Lysobacter sp.]